MIGVLVGGEINWGEEMQQFSEPGQHHHHRCAGFSGEHLCLLLCCALDDRLRRTETWPATPLEQHSSVPNLVNALFLTHSDDGDADEGTEIANVERKEKRQSGTADKQQERENVCTLLLSCTH